MFSSPALEKFERSYRCAAPFFEVLAMGEGAMPGSPWTAAGYAVKPPPRHFLEQQWVSRYEISVREAGGRAWRSLGNFKGNDDATTERNSGVSRM